MNYKAINFGKLTTLTLSFVLAASTCAETNKDIRTGNYNQNSNAGTYLSLGGTSVALNSETQSFDISESFVGFGYTATPEWSFELSYLNTQYEELTSSLVNYRALDLSTIYHLGQSAESGFHLRAGIGKRNFSASSLFPESDTSFKIGAGYNVSLNENLFVTLAAEAHKQVEQKNSDRQLIVSLNYMWGYNSKPKNNNVLQQVISQKTPIVAPITSLDADFDGVMDEKDNCPNTPLHYLVNSKGCQMLVIDKETVTLQINFAFDSVVISSEYFGQIESIARFLKKHAHLELAIEGHTDNVGSAQYNLKLSQQRANAVKALLIERYQITENRLSAIGYGDTKPLQSNATQVGQIANRRVQAVLSVQVKKPQLK